MFFHKCLVVILQVLLVAGSVKAGNFYKLQHGHFLEAGVSNDGAVDVDPVAASLAKGTFEFPEFDQSNVLDGTDLQWKVVTSDEYGRFEAPSGSWLAFSFESSEEGPAFFNCSGHDMAFVNGQPHTGKTESQGVLKMPVSVRSGANQVLIRTNGSSVTADVELLTGDNRVFMSMYDVTLPNLINMKPVDVYGAILVINATDHPLDGKSIASFAHFEPHPDMIMYPNIGPTEWNVDPMVSVPPNSVRKVPFRIVGPPPYKPAGLAYSVDIEIRDEQGTVIASSVVNLATRYPKDRMRLTWRSALDDSVQSCVLVPAVKKREDGKKIHSHEQGLLVALTPSMKTVNGMARAYTPREDAHVVVPTARRVGVSGTPLGRLDVLEAMDAVRDRKAFDSRKCWISGYADSADAAWRMACRYPGRFAAVIPVGTDLSDEALDPISEHMHVLLRWGAHDPGMTPDTAEQLQNLLQDRVGVLKIDVVPEENAWWGRKTLEPDDLGEFLASARLGSGVDQGESLPERSGFDRLLEGSVTLVYGTNGSDEENLLLKSKARYDQERMWTKANSGARVIADRDFDPDSDVKTNLILYGNADTNLLWSSMVADGALQVKRGAVHIGPRAFESEDLVAVFIQSHPDGDGRQVGFVSPTGQAGHRLMMTLPVTEPGRFRKDWIVLDPAVLSEGQQAILAAGYLDAERQIDPAQTIWRQDIVAKR